MAKRPVREPLPGFATEAEEREFWETHDTTRFVDWDRARIAAFPNLKPSTETISLRLPSALLSELKALANKRDVPYQSLLKVFLADRVARESGRIDTLPGKALRPARGARPRSRKRSRTARG
jgi:predicted DNA binding CopG/RHH family protein